MCSSPRRVLFFVSIVAAHDLLIKMIPPVVTTETLQNGQKPVVEFRLFDSNTNKSFSHVTYRIIIEKDNKILLRDLFHDHNG
ncbi:MAG: hypothetical protein WBZ20_10675, partial [Nitrososphaeraceae archaeon]